MDEPVTIRAVRFKVVSHPRQGHELWTGTKLNGMIWSSLGLVSDFILSDQDHMTDLAAGSKQ